MEGTDLEPGTIQEDFRLMVDAVSDYAIFLIDVHGCIRTWNTGARQIKGYQAEDVIGRHIRIFYPEEVAARGWPEHELEVAGREGRFEDEGWRLRKDGSRFWANIIITKLVNAQGEFIGFSKITRDLSERRRQEDLLRHSEERFRLLVEGVKDYAIFMLDPDGRVASWNLGAQRTKGYLASEIIGQHFSVFYPPELIASGWPAEELRLALLEGQFEDEGWRLRKDGSRFWASVVITPLFDERGVHRGFAKVTRDMTEKRRISALEDEGRRMATFLAMLGHELRNPLAPIANALSVMDLVDPESPHARAARAVIARQVAQLSRLVDDLLDVGRITSGKIHLRDDPVDLRQVLIEAAEAAEPLAHARNHSLVLDLPERGPWIQGDKARMLQVVGNLLTNAVKFTPDGGRIVACASRIKEIAEVSISDNGVGIPVHLLRDIFNPFVQADQDLARSQGGLGLGLSLVQQVVAMHGGQVAAYSSSQSGGGSEFIITLPLAAVQEQASSDPAQDKPASGRRVLVVDDNEDSANTMRMVLGALGHLTFVAYDGIAAIEAIKRHAPELVLLDIGLPGLSGLEVARRVRDEVASPPPLVAITGYGQDEDREATTAAGFIAHLTKPVKLADICAILDRLPAV